MTTCTDQQVLEWICSGVAEGLTQAVECLYRRLLVKIRPWALAHKLDAETMHDVLTDAIYQFVKRCQEGKYREQGKLDSMILLIAQRRYLDRFRSGQRELTNDPDRFVDIGESEPTDPLEEAEAQMENLAKHNKLAHCMDQIGERCKERLVRFWFLKQTHEEIAAAMGDKSPDVSKAMKNKCQLKLETCMKTK